MRCFDGHCDTLARCLATGEGLRKNTGHVDFARCAALGQHAQVFAVFADSAAVNEPLYAIAQRQHALLERECARNADLVRRCRTARDVRAPGPPGKRLHCSASRAQSCSTAIPGGWTTRRRGSACT